MRCGKWMLLLVGTLAGLAINSASAQPSVSLTGTYRCVQGCAPGFEGKTASITQNGWDLNIVTDLGWPPTLGLTGFRQQLEYGSRPRNKAQFIPPTR